MGGPGHTHYEPMWLLRLDQCSVTVFQGVTSGSRCYTSTDSPVLCACILNIECSMAKKRPLEEFEGVSEIQICKSAKVQGVVTSLWPLKSNKTGTTKYFEGEISDWKSCRRLVDFDAKLHSKLQEDHEKKTKL